MNAPVRKRSPRSPSVSLDEALDRALKIYAIEGKHSAPADVVAKHLGYSAATNGSAATMIASMRYFGLMDRPKEGHLAISKDVEAYQFAPSEDIRKNLLRKWVKSPQVFSDLLTKYEDSLPSSATLKYELLQAGFSPSAADECVSAFLRSVDFSKVYLSPAAVEAPTEETSEENVAREATVQQDAIHAAPTASISQRKNVAQEVVDTDADRIPIRLAGGRRAWLIVPSPFFEADKMRIIAQIDLLLIDEPKE